MALSKLKNAIPKRRRASKPVVQIVAPMGKNPLVVAFMALRNLGIEIVHARVLAKGGNLIQQFQLSLSDGSALSGGRLRDALDALRAACGATPTLTTWA